MSGGVDSSVAAALLKEQGYSVIGITMQIWPDSQSADGCCSLSAVEDARRVADKLKIPHYVLNFKDYFFKTVVEDFINEYKNGRTPNPCVRCNQFVKFDLLLKKEKELGADFLATGHYAQIKCPISNVQFPMKEFTLLKGKDKKKDQSYFLYVMGQEALRHTLFPVGNLAKAQVRKLAAKYKLPVANKAESQEICFVPDNNYAGFLKKYIPQSFKTGPIVDEQGRELGRHKGIIHYTVGQRKGLGLSGGPWYVIKIDKNSNTIIVDKRNKTFGKEVYSSKFNWISGIVSKKPIKGSAKIRYNSPDSQATLITEKNGKVKIIFKNPQKAITPGQSVVFYQKNMVIGGGVID